LGYSVALRLISVLESPQNDRFRIFWVDVRNPHFLATFKVILVHIKLRNHCPKYSRTEQVAMHIYDFTLMVPAMLAIFIPEK